MLYIDLFNRSVAYFRPRWVLIEYYKQLLLRSYSALPSDEPASIDGADPLRVEVHALPLFPYSPCTSWNWLSTQSLSSDLSLYRLISSASA